MTMRLLLLAFVFACSTAPLAMAAPTCVDATGQAQRCATAGAMPVGWKPDPEVVALRQAIDPQDPTPREIFSLVAVVGGLLALIALMPDFEGAGGGWDREEDEG